MQENMGVGDCETMLAQGCKLMLGVYVVNDDFSLLHQALT